MSGQAVEITTGALVVASLSWLAPLSAVFIKKLILIDQHKETGLIPDQKVNIFDAEHACQEARIPYC